MDLHYLIEGLIEAVVEQITKPTAWQFSSAELDESDLAIQIQPVDGGFLGEQEGSQGDFRHPHAPFGWSGELSSRLEFLPGLSAWSWGVYR